MQKFSLKVNGETREIEAPADKPLLWVLREDLGLAGTKYGCGIAQCGACTVHLDGQAQRSCVLPVQAAAGMEIVTIEGLSGKEAEAIEQAWTELDVPQCGYCQSGQIMTAIGLLRENASPSDEDIDAAMSGNICRCATYVRIRKGIKAAAEKMRA